MARCGAAGSKIGDLSNPLSSLSEASRISDRYSRPSTSETSSGINLYETNTRNGTDYAQSSEFTPLPLTSFRRMNDVVLPTIPKFTVYTPSTSSASTSGKVQNCHVCSKPPSTAYSRPLKRCVLCKRAYHLECHNPPITLNQQPEETSWHCSRCNRTRDSVAKMNSQAPSPKRALSSSPNQDTHTNPGRHRAPKRSKTVATNDESAIDPSRHDSAPRSDPKVYSLLNKMSKQDGWLAKLILKVRAGGAMPQSEHEQFNHYYDNARIAMESRAQPPPTTEEHTVEDLVSSRKEAKAAKSKQHISPMPPAQPDVERPIAPVTLAFTRPTSQAPRSHSPLFVSPGPDSHAEKTMTSTQKSSQRGDDGSGPSLKHRQPSFDHAVKLFAHPSTSSLQPLPNPPVSSTTPRQRSNAARISDVARGSRSISVAEAGTLKSSVHSIKERTNNTSKFPPSVHSSKARTSSYHQVEKGKVVADNIEDEEAKIFAKYEKKKPTTQDFEAYRQGGELALVPRNETVPLNKTVPRNKTAPHKETVPRDERIPREVPRDETEELLDSLGVKVWETETLERHVLKTQFGLTGPPVDDMMRKKFGPKEPSVEKPRSNVEQQRPAVSSAELETYETTVKKLQENIGQREGVISEKNDVIAKLQAEVNQLKQIQTRLSEREQALTKATEHLNNAGTEKRKLKTQLAAVQEDLEKAQGKVLEDDARRSKYEAGTKAREETDIEIEAANLRDENAALKKAVASLKTQIDPFVGYHFAHKNLFASPLVPGPTPTRVQRAKAAAAPMRERARLSRTSPEEAEEEESEESSVYREGTEDEGSEWEEGTTKNQRSMMALDGWLEMPPLPKPMRLEGVLAYRDATRDERGRLPRAKKFYKVGRNVAGQLR